MTNKRKLLAAMGTAIVSMSLMGCGKGRMQSQLVKKAPVEKTEVGALVQLKSSQDLESLLESFPQARYRILSEKHHLFEIFNVELTKLAQSQLVAEVYQNNDVFQYKPEQQNLLEEKIFFQNQTLKESPKPCEGEPGQIYINVQDSEEIQNKIHLLGTSLKFDAHNSSYNDGSPAELKFFWAVLYPKGSVLAQNTDTGISIFSGEKLEVTPDSMGMYQMQVLAQDSHNKCSLLSLQFYVTQNPKYVRYPDNEQITQAPIELDLHHIAEIGWDKQNQTTTGDHVVVAVVDSGVNYNHKALNANIFTNINEIPDNNIDDDQNGFVDDVVGYDFAFGDSQPFDDQGHGTHVAGLIASPATGIASHAKILPIKAMSATGDVGSVAAAILYAVDSGADIINLSLGNYGAPHPLLVMALSYAEQKDVLVVAAAGNGDEYGVGVNTDETPHFPSSLPHSNLITVAACGKGEALTSYSNYGSSTVDITAPGGNFERQIMSTMYDNPQHQLYIGNSGTSMATPIVSGALALVKELAPHLTAAEIIKLVSENGQKMAELQGKVTSGSELNIKNVIDILKK